MLQLLIEIIRLFERGKSAIDPTFLPFTAMIVFLLK